MDNTEGVAKEKEVRQELGAINNNLAGLSDTLKRLQDRLKPVLSPKPEQATPPTQGESPKLCELAEELRGYDFRICNMSIQISDILNDLEI